MHQRGHKKSARAKIRTDFIGQLGYSQRLFFLLGVPCGDAMPDDHDDREDMHAGGIQPDGRLETSDQPETILRASLVKLGEELAVAFESVARRDDVEYERARYIHALSAVSSFNNAPLNYAQRLHRLAVALSDLNEGKTDSLLAQSSFGLTLVLPLQNGLAGPMPRSEWLR